MCFLIGGVAVLFVVFAVIFEKCLQIRVTRPIQELSSQIKNPTEFMAARNKSVDIYTRRQTIATRKSSANSDKSSRRDTSEPSEKSSDRNSTT